MQFVDIDAIDIDEPLYNPYDVNYSSSESDENDPEQRSRAPSVLQEYSQEHQEPRIEPALISEEGDRIEFDVTADDCSGFAKDIGEKADGFRVNAKWVLLTYPKLGRNRPDPERYRKRFEDLGCTAGIIGIERHRSGEYHIHCLIEKVTKWDTRSVRYFDIDGHHPNIRTILNGRWEGAEEYTLKDGDFLKWNIRTVPCSSKNYLKRKADREAWERDIKSARWPLEMDGFDLPDGSGAYVSALRSKRRGLVVVGEPNMGKTGWLLHVLRRARYYEARNELNPWDGYDGSRVIVWNDQTWWPTKTDLCFLTDIGKRYHRGGYLKARFYDKRIEPGNMTLIILCNPASFDQAPYRYEGWFLERFKIVNMVRPWKCIDENCIDCEDK